MTVQGKSTAILSSLSKSYSNNNDSNNKNNNNMNDSPQLRTSHSLKSWRQQQSHSLIMTGTPPQVLRGGNPPLHRNDVTGSAAINRTHGALRDSSNHNNNMWGGGGGGGGGGRDTEGESYLSPSGGATNLGRSRSFGGMLHRSGVSGGASGEGHNGGLVGGAGTPTSPTGTPVLGEAYRGHGPSSGVTNHPLGAGASLSRKHTFSRKAQKLPKVPRPERVHVIFDAVKRGLREWILATEDDIAKLRTMEDLASSSSSSAAQAKLHEIEKQIRQAERFRTRIEFQLAKIEELEEDYTLQQQLRNGVRNMAKAYVSSTGSHQKESLLNVKCGFKECTQTMCAIEAQLESMLGTFHCKLRGLAGFARLTPGDVFQVVVSHGTQKWKSKGRITSKAQKWDNDYCTLKALVGDVLNIKALEVKGFRMPVDLGHKNCETRELFCAAPQIMTVSINANGSIKLSIVISWNPLEGGSDIGVYYEPSMHKSQSTMYLAPVSPLLGPQKMPYKAMSGNALTRSQTSPEHMASSAPARSAHSHPNRISVPIDCYRNLHPPPSSSSHSSSSPLRQHNINVSPHIGGGSLSSATTSSYPSSLSNPATTNESNTNFTRPHSVAITGSIADSLASSGDLSSHKNRLFDMRLLSDSLNGATVVNHNSGSPVRSSHINGHVGHALPGLADGQMVTGAVNGHSEDNQDVFSLGDQLERVVDQLKSNLEDYQGQYVELVKLEQQIQILHNMILRSSGARQSRSSDVSISVETALGAFDFLESEDYLDLSSNHRPSHDPSPIRGLETDVTSPAHTTTTTTLASRPHNHSSSPYHQHHPNHSDSHTQPHTHHHAHAGSPSRNVESTTTSTITTGDSEVDHALVWHLCYCERLIENLGKFGPLKCREIYSLDKLNKQADIIEDLLRIASDTRNTKDMENIISRVLVNKSEVHGFWLRCIDGYKLSVDVATIMVNLDRSYGDIVRDQYSVTASKVFTALVARVLDVPFVDSERINAPPPLITMHQLCMYFSCDKPDLLAYVQQIAREVCLSSRLRSGDTDLVIKTLLGFRDSLPPTECLRVTALLLIAQNKEVHNAAENYLKAIERRPILRQKAMVVYVEGLEDKNADVRCASCIALKTLKAVESLDQLVYICHTDSSQVVKSHAKEALLSFGDLGRRAYDESQRSSHGFQGVVLSNRHLI